MGVCSQLCCSGGFETTESNFHRRRKIKSQAWLANPKDPNLTPPVVRISDSLSWPLISASVAECMGKKCCPAGRPILRRSQRSFLGHFAATE